MDRGLPHLLLLGLICLMPVPGVALELFGVDLETTSRDELRSAVKEAGVVLIREDGNDEWFDVYDSSEVLEGSSRLYLGFVKQDQRFAFAEYEFNGLNPDPILRHLTGKYGDAEIRKGRYISDRSYRWKRDGIEIRLRSDWQNYKFRLSYIEPTNLANLLAEQSGNPSPDPESPEYSVY